MKKNKELTQADMVKFVEKYLQGRIDNCHNNEEYEQAEKAYNIMQKSFEIGSATFVTLNDAELALTHARLAYSQAIYDFLAGVSDVKKLLGTTDISKYEPQENNK